MRALAYSQKQIQVRGKGPNKHEIHKDTIKDPLYLDLFLQDL